MTKTMDDLSYFLKSIIEMEPWNYDHTVHPIPWKDFRRDLDLSERKIRWGVMRDDGIFSCPGIVKNSLTRPSQVS